MQRFKIALIIILLPNPILGQHTIEFDKRIKDKVLHDQTGIVLIQTPDEVYGINPETQDIIWEQQAPDQLDFSSYSEIPFTPLVIFDRKPLLSSGLLSNTVGAKGTSRTILNVYNGRILFDSEIKGYKAVNNTLLIPERQAIFVDGVKNGEPVIGFYDYKTGRTLWETSLTSTSVFKTVKSSLFDKEEVALDADKNIFWLKKKFLLKIDSYTGNISYEREGVTSFKISNDGTKIFIFSNQIKLRTLNNESAIEALTTNRLTPIWNTELVVWGGVKQAVIDNEKLVVITSKGFNIIDTEIGRKHWDKSSFLPLIKKIVPIDKGYIVAQDKFLNYVNPNGEKIWEKPVKISLSSDENPIHIFDDSEAVLYITPSQANKVLLTNATNVWEDITLNNKSFITRNLKLKEHPYRIWYDEELKQFPVFSENNFYIFNNQATQAPTVAYTFDFEKAARPNLKITHYGYFLNHKNNFFLFDTAGNVIYSKLYPAVDNTTIFKTSTHWVKRGVKTYTSAIGFTANQINQTFRNIIVSKDIGLFNQVASGVYGSYQSYQNLIGKVTSVNSLDFDSSLQSIFDRIKKGEQEERGILVVVPTSSDTLKIIRLNIATGEEEVLKELEEDRSDFIIDQLENTIYFFSKKDVVIERL